MLFAGSLTWLLQKKRVAGSSVVELSSVKNPLLYSTMDVATGVFSLIKVLNHSSITCIGQVGQLKGNGV